MGDIVDVPMQHSDLYMMWYRKIIVWDIGRVVRAETGFHGVGLIIDLLVRILNIMINTFLFPFVNNEN